MTRTTDTHESTFEDVISCWDEPVRCQSIYGCQRRAVWRAGLHKGCGGPSVVCCTQHYQLFVRAALLSIAEYGYVGCRFCDRHFKTVEGCVKFRPL